MNSHPEKILRTPRRCAASWRSSAASRSPASKKQRFPEGATSHVSMEVFYDFYEDSLIHLVGIS